MLQFLADENLTGPIVRGLLRCEPPPRILRVQDAGLAGADDPSVLEFAANMKLVVLTHDVRTMAGFAYDRVDKGLEMPGLIEVKRLVPVGLAIEEIYIIAAATEPSELEGRVIFIPM